MVQKVFACRADRSALNTLGHGKPKEPSVHTLASPAGGIG